MIIYQIAIAVAAAIILSLSIYIYRIRRDQLFNSTGDNLQSKQLELQNKQLETIVNSMSDMAVLTIADKKGDFIQYSDSANTYFLKDTYEKRFGSAYRKGVFFHPDGREMEYSELPGMRVLRGEKVSNLHFIMKDSEGEKHFLSNASPVYDSNGSLLYSVLFSQDITKQVLHERLVPVTEQLAAKNALKDKLFTVVAHDIRNPMANLITMIGLLEGEEGHSGEYRELIAAVGTQVKNTYLIIENLLDWVRTQKDCPAFNPMPWSLSAIAGGAVNLYRSNAEAKEIGITNHIEEDITVFADRDLLDPVFRNLIHNAIKYTGTGGKIDLQANQSGHKVIVSIRDTGIGMEPEKAKMLFRDMLAESAAGTAGEKGTGLGLLICREFIERNGGKLWLESTPGEGSTFYFSIPSGGSRKD